MQYSYCNKKNGNYILLYIMQLKLSLRSFDKKINIFPNDRFNTKIFGFENKV